MSHFGGAINLRGLEDLPLTAARIYAPLRGTTIIAPAARRRDVQEVTPRAIIYPRPPTLACARKNTNVTPPKIQALKPPLVVKFPHSIPQ